MGRARDDARGYTVDQSYLVLPRHRYNFMLGFCFKEEIAVQHLVITLFVQSDIPEIFVILRTITM